MKYNIQFIEQLEPHPLQEPMSQAMDEILKSMNTGGEYFPCSLFFDIEPNPKDPDQALLVAYILEGVLSKDMQLPLRTFMETVAQYSFVFIQLDFFQMDQATLLAPLN